MALFTRWAQAMSALWLKAPGILIRRAIHKMVLWVPQPVRTRLSKSAALTRLFVYFDRSRYEALDGSDPLTMHLGGSTSEYLWQPPSRDEEQIRELNEWAQRPLISVLMPTWNTDPRWLNEAISSVTAQWYNHWELVIVDDASTRQDTLNCLGAIDHPSIRIVYQSENRNIAATSNHALSEAKGEFVALMDHDDLLSPDALMEAACHVRDCNPDFIYSDEDKIDVNGHHLAPHFKPDFAPDTLLSQNYISHLGIIRTSLVRDAGGFSEGTDGAQDYDLYLKVLERTDRIVHIPKVLYHWRKVPGSTALHADEKDYARDAAIGVLQAAVKRRQWNAEVEKGLWPGTYRVQRRIREKPLVSIIVPFRDRSRLTHKCFRSILKKSSWQNFEIIAVSNNSSQSATRRRMENWPKQDERLRVFEHNVPFNFSLLNNHAVNEWARGEHIILLNNDIEIISPHWIESLLEHSQRDDVGAVGGKLYYPNRKVQHAGIIIGIGGVAGHSHKFFPAQHHGYFSRLSMVQNLSAVTGAMMMVKRKLYQGIGGLNEQNLAVAFNDVDFCLRLREQGLLNVFTPYAQAWHHESLSRGHEDSPEKQSRFESEVRYMMKRHAEILADGDPYYSPHLTLIHENFSYRSQPGVAE